MTRKERQALILLGRGGARYGTRITEMYALKERGLCYAHDKGPSVGAGRWTWRPTEAGWKAIAEMKQESRNG